MIMVVDSTDRARVGIAKVSWHALHSVHDLTLRDMFAEHGPAVLVVCCD